MTDVDTLTEYYQDLLLYQYINSTKARSTIGLLCSQAISDLIPLSVRDAFDIDTATGYQLDILGEYIGFSRNVTTPIIRDYFKSDDQENLAGNTYGFTSYLDNTNSNIALYAYVNSESASFSLSDDEYRTMLKLKSFINISNLSFYEVDLKLYEIFSSNIVLFDLFNMSILYFVNETYERLIYIATLNNLLPKPMGVLIAGLFVNNDPTNIWGISNYLNTTGYGVGFTDYLTDNGISTANVLDSTDWVS